MRKGQSIWASFGEANATVLSGFILSMLVYKFVIGPLWNLEISLFDSLGVTAIFTVSSLIRSFIVRRIFNWWGEKK